MVAGEKQEKQFEVEYLKVENDWVVTMRELRRALLV